MVDRGFLKVIFFRCFFIIIDLMLMVIIAFLW